ncbi:MAG: hypothetical protein V5A44_08285 [Haloarculaceae archaeon]
MRRDAFDKAGEEFAEEIVADLPATSTEIAAELPEDIETFVEDTPELPDDAEALADDLPDELLNRMDTGNNTANSLSILLPDELSEELD